MSMTRIHPLSVRHHSYKARRSTKEFNNNLRADNKQLIGLLMQCNKMFLSLGYKKRTAVIRDEITQILTHLSHGRINNGGTITPTSP